MPFTDGQGNLFDPFGVISGPAAKADCAASAPASGLAVNLAVLTRQKIHPADEVGKTHTRFTGKGTGLFPEVYVPGAIERQEYKLRWPLDLLRRLLGFRLGRNRC